MTNARNSVRNFLLLSALLMPALAACGGGADSTPPTTSNPPVTQPPVIQPPVIAPPITSTPPVTVTPPITSVPPVTNPALPPVIVTIDRPAISVVENANIPPQTFILTINRTPDQVPGLHLMNVNRSTPGTPTVGTTGTTGSYSPEVKNGTSTWYIQVSGQGSSQGEYSFDMSVYDMPGNVIGTTGLKVTVTHDLRLESDLNSWSAYERQVFALVNEVRTQGSLGGDRSVVAGTCAAGAGPLKALLPSSVGYAAAHGHVNWLATYGYTAHTEPDASYPSFYGDTMTDRIIRASNTVGTDVSPQAEGENAAAGQATPTEVMLAWLNSAGHCHNLMDPSYTHMGAGYASATPRSNPTGTVTVYAHSWVQVFLKY